MRTVSPLVLVASAAGVAVFAHVQDEYDASGPPPARPVAEREAQPIVPAVSPEPRRSFAPQSPQFAAASSESDSTSANGKGEGADRFAPAPASSMPVPAKRAAPSTWTTVVTADPGALPKSRAKPQRDEDVARYERARDLQRELKRAGCYYGEIDGDWGPGSRRAMAEFADRVNATLPIEVPDVVLLALVQAHAGQVCGRTCPAGQGLDGDGRCLPRAVLAQGEKKAGERTKRAETIERERKAALERLARAAERAHTAGQPAPGAKLATAPPPPLPGRMSVGTGSGRIAPAGDQPGLETMDAREASVTEPDPVAAPKRPKRSRAAQKPRYAERAAPRPQRTLIYNLFQRIERVN